MISGLIRTRVVTASDDLTPEVSTSEKRAVATKFLKGLIDYFKDLGRNIKFIGGFEYTGPVVKTRFLLSGGSDPESHSKEFQEANPSGGRLDVVPIIIPPNGLGAVVERRQDGVRFGVETHIAFNNKDYVRIIGDPSMYDRVFHNRMGKRGRPPKLYTQHLTQEKWDLIRNPPPPGKVGRSYAQETGPLSPYLAKKWMGTDIQTYEQLIAHDKEEAEKRASGKK